MNKLYVNELTNNIGKTISFSGFVDTIRDKKWVQFIILRDSTGKVQMTLDKGIETNKDMVEMMSKVTKDSTIKIDCQVVANDAVKLGGIELIPSHIEITSVAEELPFDYNNLDGVNIDTRLDYRWLDLRNEKNMLARQVESCFVQNMRNYLYENDFTEIHTPKLIGAASESGSEVFEVKYFDRKAYLAQSPQFYKQMAMAAGFGRVFEVAPCFRAEKSYTKKHSTEFTSFDVEFAHIDSFEDVMNLESEMITYAFKKVKELYDNEIKEVLGLDINIPTMPFPEMTLKDVYKEI